MVLGTYLVWFVRVHASAVSQVYFCTVVHFNLKNPETSPPVDFMSWVFQFNVGSGQNAEQTHTIVFVSIMRHFSNGFHEN